jgi:NADP-dependent 3-hydroxy acid dehydrogenase YdfG
MSKVVLITGCSTGIGRDLAQHLTQAGYQVVATARHAESLDGLQAKLNLSLDVTREDSVNEAVASVLKEFGRIDVLVNNAGYALLGALEEVSDKAIQQMFDVNVFGALRMIRAVAPHMRRQGSGRVLNISSIAGKVSTPVSGAYSATKFALAPFGIQVISIEPGAIKTHFDETAQLHAQGILSNSSSPYQPLYQKSEEFGESMRNQQFGVEVVSEAIQQAIESANPKPRYLVGVSSSGRLAITLRDLVWDGALKSMFSFAPRKETQ